MNYEKSSKYTDMERIYEQCSGPGGLKLTEYLMEKMGVQGGKRLVDIGVYRGYQTCFMAKEYNAHIVGIDPWDDRITGEPHIQFLMSNATDFGVSDKIIGVKSGVPETFLPTECFDYAYSTTTLEMVRGEHGMDMYLASLKEIHRILKKGGVFGLGEPMHFSVPVPYDLVHHIKSNKWDAYFATLDETVEAVKRAGFSVLRSGYCEEADDWWNEFALYAPDYDAVEADVAVIQNNNNRWLSFGYVIAIKI